MSKNRVSDRALRSDLTPEQEAALIRAEKFGGEGRIQYNRTKSIDYSKLKYGPKPEEISWIWILCGAVAVSCAAEYYRQWGTPVLMLGLLCTAVYACRARPHDNIPLAIEWHPIIGHLINSVRRYHDIYDVWIYQFEKLKKETGETVFAACMPLNKTFVFLSEPHMLDAVWRLQFGDVDKGEDQQEALGCLLGNGVLIADGEAWKRQRSAGSALFTARSLKDHMTGVFQSNTELLMTKLMSYAQSQPKQAIDLNDMFYRITLDSFVEVAFGVKLDSITKYPSNIKFAESFDTASVLSVRRFYNTLWVIEKFFNIGKERLLKKNLTMVNEFIENVIKERKKELQNRSQLSKSYDIVSLYLDKYPNASSLELRDFCVNFVLAGRETTAILMSWLVYVLTQKENAHIYQALMNELNQVCGTNPWTDEVTFEQVRNLEYFELCLMETLRLYPSAPIMVRKARQDIPLSDGHILRKGDSAVYCTYTANRLESNWDHPLKFDPLRFKGKVHTPAEMAAFGLPPRLCLGKHLALLETKIILAQFLRAFEFEMVPGQKIVYEPAITLPMKYGFKCFLKARTFAS